MELHASLEAYGASGKLMEYHKAFETACKLMELHTNSWNCIQAYGTACKLLELYASLWNSIQAYGTAFKLMELHACL